jgi:hypothetical protein
MSIFVQISPARSSRRNTGIRGSIGLHDTISESVPGRGLDLRPVQVPREIIEPGPRDPDSVRFFEPADAMRSRREVSLMLKDSAIPSEELTPEVRKPIESWSHLIDCLRSGQRTGSPSCTRTS